MQAGAGEEVILAWVDPGSEADHPAWPLRNALLAAAAAVRVRRLRVVCARMRGAAVSTSASLLLDVTLPDVPSGVALPLTILHIPGGRFGCHVHIPSPQMSAPRTVAACSGQGHQDPFDLCLLFCQMEQYLRRLLAVLLQRTLRMAMMESLRGMLQHLQHDVCLAVSTSM